METTYQKTQTNAMPLSLPRILLHLEGLAVFIAVVAAYIHLHGSGWTFALLLLTPDLSMLGYLKDLRTGAISYNIAHFYGLPLALLTASYLGDWETGVLLALIWLAHIGMDRALGYGLKYDTEFKDTHIGRV